MAQSVLAAAVGSDDGSGAMGRTWRDADVPRAEQRMILGGVAGSGCEGVWGKTKEGEGAVEDWRAEMIWLCGRLQLLLS
jgi:hypothetical protein